MKKKEREWDFEITRREKDVLEEGVAYFLGTGITPIELLYFLSDRIYGVHYMDNWKPDPNIADTFWGLKVLMDWVVIPWVEENGAEEVLLYGFFKVRGMIGGEALRDCINHVFKSYGNECSQGGYTTIKGMKRLMPCFCALSNMSTCLEGFEILIKERPDFPQPM